MLDMSTFLLALAQYEISALCTLLANKPIMAEQNQQQAQPSDQIYQK
jgi:hypothetical protein